MRAVNKGKHGIDCLIDGAQVLRLHHCRLLIGGRFIEEELWVQNGRIIDPRHQFWALKKRVCAPRD